MIPFEIYNVNLMCRNAINMWDWLRLCTWGLFDIQVKDSRWNWNNLNWGEMLMYVQYLQHIVTCVKAKKKDTQIEHVLMLTSNN